LLRTFEVAARHLSFKKAAAELNVTPAAVSQQIKALEAHMGVHLFQRLTRALQLTERGAALLPGVQDGLACLVGAVDDVRVPAPGSVLLVAAPPLLSVQWLIPRLPAFYAAHPDIEVHLSSTSTAVDHGGDAAALDALDAAPDSDRSRLTIVYGTGPYARFRADALFNPAYVPVCAPGLATAAAPLRVPADLCSHVLIHDDTLRGAGNSGRHAWGWDQWLRAAGLVPPARHGSRRFSNAVLAVEAALRGQGVLLASRPLLAAHIAAGTLVVPFEAPIRSPYSYFLVAREGSAERPAVAAFRQWLLERARPLAAV
jgi:LysR family glycine cleavage system transcriptional activator